MRASGGDQGTPLLGGFLKGVESRLSTFRT
jgi:hypothetical protein